VLLHKQSAKVPGVASFPPYAFLENIIVRYDGSILVTTVNPKDLYHLPRPQSEEVIPQRLHTFDQPNMEIVELEPDLFCIATGTTFEDRPIILWERDMRPFSPSDVPKPVPVLHFPPQ
jgi:hypothetical protein